MNFWCKFVCSVSAFITVLGSSSASYAQTCPAGTTPMTKQRLDAVSALQRIPTNINWLAFENFALKSVNDAIRNDAVRLLRASPPPMNPFLEVPFPFRVNTDPSQQVNFTSPERATRTSNRVRAVAPDGHGPLRVFRYGEFTNEVYLDSAFYEVKAVRNGVLTLGYPRASTNDFDEPTRTFDSYQIFGMIDVLSRSSASNTADVVPSLMFLTTSDVTVPQETRARATLLDVGIWHSIACEHRSSPPITPTNPVTLQMSNPRPLNPQVYEVRGLSTPGRAPGVPGILLNPRP